MIATARGVAREQSAGRMLLAACPAAFLATLSALALSPFLPTIAEELHTSVALLGQIPAVMMLLAAALGLIVGPLADSLGRRRVLLAGVLAVAASSLTIALAPGYAALLMAALFGAVSRAAVVPVANAIVGGRGSSDDARRAISRVVGAIGVAVVVGVPLLTVLSTPLGWRGAFLVLALAALGVAALTWRVLPADAAERHAGLRPGTVLDAYRPLVSNGPLLSLYAASALRNTAIWSVVIYLGAFLVQERGLSTPQVGLVFGGLGLGQLVGSLLAGGRLGRVPLRPLLGGLNVALGCLAGFFLLLPVTTFAAVGLLAVAMVANGGTDVAEATLLSAATGSGRATRMTLHGSVQSVGSALGGSCGGALLLWGGYPALGLAVPLIGVAAALLLWVTRPRSAPSPLAVAAAQAAG